MRPARAHCRQGRAGISNGGAEVFRSSHLAFKLSIIIYFSCAESKKISDREKQRKELEEKEYLQDLEEATGAKLRLPEKKKTGGRTARPREKSENVKSRERLKVISRFISLFILRFSEQALRQAGAQESVGHSGTNPEGSCRTQFRPSIQLCSHKKINYFFVVDADPMYSNKQFK